MLRVQEEASKEQSEEEMGLEPHLEWIVCETRGRPGRGVHVL